MLASLVYQLPLWMEEGKDTVFVGASSEETPAAYDVDYAFGLGSTNAQLYDSAVAPLVSRVFDGSNATIIAYGNTLYTYSSSL